MSDNMSTDMDEIFAKSSVSEAFKALGQWTVQFQEEEAKMQRIAQQLSRPENRFQFETSALQDTVLDLKLDPIIPKGYFEKTQEYQEKSLEMLQSINENTANLYTLVELINQNGEKQDELIALMTEILSMAKAKTKADAESRFKKIMGKITDATENVEAIIKMAGWATTVYNIVSPMLK